MSDFLSGFCSETEIEPATMSVELFVNDCPKKYPPTERKIITGKVIFIFFMYV